MSTQSIFLIVLLINVTLFCVAFLNNLKDIKYVRTALAALASFVIHDYYIADLTHETEQWMKILIVFFSIIWIAVFFWSFARLGMFGDRWLPKKSN